MKDNSNLIHNDEQRGILCEILCELFYFKTFFF